MICENCGKEYFEDYRRDKKFIKNNSSRFCSRKCSNAISNRHYTEVRYCKACGKPMGAGYLIRNKSFCNHKCQQVLRKQNLTEQWLLSGGLKGYTGGKSCATVTSSYVRDYIIEDQDFKCAECHMPMEHNGKPLVFILDHINGDATNNSRENLRLLCPNCDSQSPTFKGRNKGKGRRARGFESNQGL